MSADELPTGDPLMFNTFSGQNVPIEAYNLLTPAEAQNQLTDLDKEEYKDPEFQLVIRSRIWDDLKNSVSERRALVKARHKAAEQENEENKEENHTENDTLTETDPSNENKGSLKQVITPPTQDSNHSIKLDDGYMFVDENYNSNRSLHHSNDTTEANERKSDTIHQNQNEIIETQNNSLQTDTNRKETFANPFMNGISNNANKEKYAIPFDTFYATNANANHESTDDIWANWNAPFGQDNGNSEVRESTHVNNSSNDTNDSIQTQYKVRKSLVFADPFHWDSEDETILDNMTQNDTDINISNDARASISMANIDMNAGFKDPFHSVTPQTEPIMTKNISDSYANPFDTPMDENESKIDMNNAQTRQRNDSLLRLLFGADITEEKDTETKETFLNPFHANSNEEIALSPMLINTSNSHNSIHTLTDKKLAQITPPIHLNPSPHKQNTLFSLTPVPTAQKRQSSMIDIPSAEFAEENEMEVFPEIPIKESDIDKGADSETKTQTNMPVTQPKIIKKDSLDFSWDSQEEYDPIKNPTPPPAKMLDESLFEVVELLLEKTIQKPKSHYFVDGIPWQMWKCTDWPAHAKEPTTLVQVKEALNKGQYDTPGQFAESVRNVFRNCTTYHWKGAGQYRVKAKAMILWEDFNTEYFSVLHDESEERKREHSRKRAIDEAKLNGDSQEQEFSNTHTETEDVSIEALQEEEAKPFCSLQKHVSFNDNIHNAIEEEDEEFAAMAKMHFEMSQQLSTVPNTPAYTPQPPLFVDAQSDPIYFDEKDELPNHYRLETLLSQQELLDTPEIKLMVANISGKSNNNNTLNIIQNHACTIQAAKSLPVTPTIVPLTFRRGSNVSNASVGALSLNSRNVRFQTPAQAQRALKITNVLQNYDRRNSLSRADSLSSLRGSIFKKKKRGKTSTLLAKIAKNVPFGFDPKKRRGSIIRGGTSRGDRETLAKDIDGINGSNGRVSIPSGTTVNMHRDTRSHSQEQRHRESKELIDEFSPTFRSQRLSETKTFVASGVPKLDLQYTLEENVVPEPHSHLKYQCWIGMCFSVVLVIYMLNYRLFADQSYSLLYPMMNVGARVVSVFTEPMYIICVLGTMIVIHMQYRPALIIENKRLFVSVFVVANVLNILRVSMSECAMDFIYNLYIYLVIIATMIVPFFSFGDKWKESETVFILVIFWIAVILIGFVYVMLHQFFSIFILFVFGAVMMAWIIRFWYHHRSLGVFDSIGDVSQKYDIGYCALLIPSALLFPQLGCAIIVQISSLNNESYTTVVISVYVWYIVLKIWFVIGRQLWETTALKATDQLKYIHLMFPIFFIEELIDIILLIKLRFSYECIGMLLLMSFNHIIRDSDLGYRVLYKRFIIPFVMRLYYGYYHQSETRRNNMRLLHSQSAYDNNNNEEDQIELGLSDDETLPSKDLNLAQERDDFHVGRTILHFEMLRFVEYASRFAVLLILVMDLICDSMNLGNRLLLSGGTVNETNRWFLILLCVLSMIIIFVTSLISQRLLSKEALTSIQFLDKMEIINGFSHKERLYIHIWVIFGDECKIFKRFWIFFTFVVGYQLILIMQAFFSAANNGLISVCDVFF